MAAGDAAAQDSAAGLGLVVPGGPCVPEERLGSGRAGEGPPSQGLCAHPREIGARSRLALRKLLARPRAPGFSLPRKQV